MTLFVLVAASAPSAKPKPGELARQDTTKSDNLLNSMISQFVSPISDKIFMDYDPGLRYKKEHQHKQAHNNEMTGEDAHMLEQEEEALKAHVYMELLVHIYQSISFL